MNDLVQRPDLSDVVPERLTEILERERQRQFLEQLQILRHPARADRVDAQVDHRLAGHSLFPSLRNIARSAHYSVPSPHERVTPRVMGTTVSLRWGRQAVQA